MKLNTVEKDDLGYIHSKLNKELKILSGKRVLLTGASGFLSYYFILAFLSWNDSKKNNQIHLTLCSRFKNGLPHWLNEIKLRKDITIIKKDVAKLSLSKLNQFDYIIHAASIASPIVYRKYPLETMRANVEGLTNLLDYAIKRKKTSKNIVKSR